MRTKYIIHMSMPSRPDLDYFYAGDNREGCPVFQFHKRRAKRFDTQEDAEKQLEVFGSIRSDEILTIQTVRQFA